jgi:hypothetical protein
VSPMILVPLSLEQVLRLLLVKSYYFPLSTINKPSIQHHSSSIHHLSISVSKTPKPNESPSGDELTFRNSLTNELKNLLQSLVPYNPFQFSLTYGHRCFLPRLLCHSTMIEQVVLLYPIYLGTQIRIHSLPTCRTRLLSTLLVIMWVVGVCGFLLGCSSIEF